jgi:hypothetical protein
MGGFYRYLQKWWLWWIFLTLKISIC